MPVVRFVSRYFEPEQYALWYGTFGLIGLALAWRTWLEWQAFGTLWCNWDFMFLTGVATFVITGIYSTEQERRFHSLLRQVCRSGVLVADKTADQMTSELDGFVKRVARISCAIVFFVMAAALVGATLQDAFSDRPGSSCYSLKVLTDSAWRARRPACVTNLLTMLVVMTGCGALAGIRLGRAAGYGLALTRLKSLGAQLSPLPGHSDQRCGLQPFARFLTSQALLTLPAVLWLFIWWLIIPYWGRAEGCWRTYDHWSNPFIGVWIVAVAFLWLAFLSPLWHLHRWVAAIKRDEFEPLLRELESRIADRHHAERQAEDIESRDALRREIADLSNRHYAVRQVDTWVIGPETLRRLFVGYSITVVWPLVHQVVISGEDAPTGAATAIFTLFKNLFGG
ncbi:MAG: hypothetical protein KDC18_14985 [Alphaproteobacteria bacterium]|nr:hypothetical protein [Alphaproteobacteria bacterium]MCB9929872.1 hypothetical protein [Alphaproteobacteria bacterium]